MVKKTKSYLKKQLSLKIITILNKLFLTTSFPKYVGFKSFKNYISITYIRFNYLKIDIGNNTRYMSKTEFIYTFMTEFSLIELQYIKNYVKIYFSF
jgi:hypothetical protein